MLRLSAVALILAASVCLPAQTAAPAPVPQPQMDLGTQNFVIVLPQPTCPVQMHALQGVSSGLTAVRDGQPPTAPAQRIHLVLSGGQARQVAAAHVTVRGLSGRNRTVRTFVTAVAAPDRTHALDVKFSPESTTEIAADLVLPGFTAVLSVQLDSITYVDGTAWLVSGTRACRVAPDPLVLVTGR